MAYTISYAAEQASKVTIDNQTKNELVVQWYIDTPDVGLEDKKITKGVKIVPANSSEQTALAMQQYQVTKSQNTSYNNRKNKIIVLVYRPSNRDKPIATNAMTIPVLMDRARNISHNLLITIDPQDQIAIKLAPQTTANS